MSERLAPSTSELKICAKHLTLMDVHHRLFGTVLHSCAKCRRDMFARQAFHARGPSATDPYAYRTVKDLLG